MADALLHRPLMPNRAAGCDPGGFFDSLRAQPPDELLNLMIMFRNDVRPGRLDLGVGTYKNEVGATPVLDAVKSAERQLLQAQQTKSYLGPAGDGRFLELLSHLVLGVPDRYAGRLVAVQTPGGGGALRLGADLINAAWEGAKVWLGEPSWPNHRHIMEAARLMVVGHPYLDPTSGLVDFERIITALQAAVPGDVVLLHACCHNPTGADLSRAQWDAVADLLAARNLIPFIDFAYQGFGEGVEADADGVRRVLDKVQHALVAYSCSKNFGLYRDRVGALFVLCGTPAEAELVRSNVLALALTNWSMPPDHGAAAVRIILDSPPLAEAWRLELAGMRQRIDAVRSALASTHPRLAALGRQRGMFSLLPLSPACIQALRRDHGIYVAPGGRVNLAGLQASDARAFADALQATQAWQDAPGLK